MTYWKQDFKRDVVRAALPDWELRNEDKIRLRFRAMDDRDPTEGGNFGEWFEAYVEVSRGSECARKYFDGRDKDAVANFLNRLLE